MIEGGYLLKTALVNLSTKEVKYKQVDEGFAIKFIGGRGWGAKILYDMAEERVTPFSSENKIIISSGSLSGLPVPSSSKLNFSFISPATGLYGDSNVGCEFVISMKKAGFDAVIVDGTAKEPTYILIDNGEVTIKDAKPYWSMLSLDAEKALKRDTGGKSVLVIGPAGENLVKIACVTADLGRQAARCGVGSVLGYKRLKALVAGGDGNIPVSNMDAMIALFRDAEKQMLSHRDFPLWQRQGTMNLVQWAQEMSCLPTRNFSNAQYEKMEEISGETMERRVRLGNRGCALCEVRCGQISQVGDVKVEGPEYETTAMIGSNCALNTIEEVVQANYLCDQLGLDTISAGNIVAFAMECYERGLIDKGDTNGLELKFGNAEALYGLLEKIAYRRGLGRLLGEGVAVASKKIGKGSERFAMHVKGLEISAYDARAAPAMALAYATCDIGAHHNRAWAITYDIQTDRTSYGEDKVKRVIYLQHIRPMFDCLGVCRFPWLEFGLDPVVYARFYTAATGVQTSLDDLLKRSEGIWNLTRLISLRQGLKPIGDWLPDRVFDDPIQTGPLRGTVLDRGKFGQMVDKYYELRGWTKRGVPKKAKLKELDIA